MDEPELRGHDIVVIGASSGGIEAVSALVSSLPAELPAALFVCIHIQAGAESVLPRILSRVGPLPAVHAETGMPIERGRIYVAPPDHHLVVEPGVISLSRGPRENRARPSIDVMFRSAAIAYGPRTIGVVMSGYLDDGAAGLLTIKRCSGLAVVQDPGDARQASMPRAALDVVTADAIISGISGGATIAALVNTPPAVAARSTAQAQPRLEVGAAQDSPAAARGAIQIGTPTGIACPDCGGGLFSVKDGPLTRYRCHVGHAFNPGSLLEAQTEDTEKALWVALRALEERASLLLDMSLQMQQRGSRSAAQYAARSKELHAHAVRLRAMLSETRAERSEVAPEVVAGERPGESA